MVGFRRFDVRTRASTSDGNDPRTVYTEGYDDLLAGARYTQPIRPGLDAFADVRGGRATFSIAEPFFAGGLSGPVVTSGGSVAARGGVIARFGHLGIEVGVDYSLALINLRDDNLGTLAHDPPRSTRAQWIAFETSLQLAF